MYKGTWYEIARNLFRSRGRQHARAERLVQENRELRQANDRLRRELQQRKDRRAQAEQRCRQLEQERDQLRQQPLTLPGDVPLKHHTFGPNMISLCLNLSRQIGFRPAETALRTVFDWLGLDAEIPSFDAIRTWACRVGVAQLKSVHKDGEEWLWMADHSNQIGQEKLLVILGIRLKDLPPVGETLPRDKLVVLAVVPGKSWTRDDVRREYRRLAERMGPPAYLLTDGAVELIESADALKCGEKSPVVLRDFKHVAANVFEKLIGKDERFQSFQSRLGRTRSTIQQTELAHFTPPSPKPKSRFMNLGPTLRWGAMVSHHLSDPHFPWRQDITAERMEEKLGWVRDYRDDLAAWNRCQQVLQTSLRFINRHGVYQGAAALLRGELQALQATHPPACELSRTMASRLVTFVEESEQSLPKASGQPPPTGARAWLSTENLESLFGAYKQLEGQHSKGGLTSLIAALPMLCTRWTADGVRTALSAVSTQAMRHWTRDQLKTTLTSQRTAAYQAATPASGPRKT